MWPFNCKKCVDPISGEGIRDQVEIRVQGAIQTFVDSQDLLEDEQARLLVLKDTVDFELVATGNAKKNMDKLVKLLLET